jgi:hypothetical protein
LKELLETVIAIGMRGLRFHAKLENGAKRGVGKNRPMLMHTQLIFARRPAVKSDN